MRYKARPYEIDAFQFKTLKFQPPKWFIEAVEKGVASVTINAKDQYITVYGKDQTHKAHYMDWVCHDNGKIFVMGDKRFNSSFSKV